MSEINDNAIIWEDIKTHRIISRFNIAILTDKTINNSNCFDWSEPCQPTNSIKNNQNKKLKI